MELKDFQSKHGPAWARIINSDAYQDASILLSINKLNYIQTMSNEDITTHGAIILADLRGHLQHEFGLNSLLKLVEGESNEPTTEYGNQLEEAAESAPIQPKNTRKKR